MRTIRIGKKIEVVEKRPGTDEVLGFIERLVHDDIALVPCPCRTGTEVNGDRECAGKNPVGACIFLGVSAVHVDKKGIGKRISKENVAGYVELMTSFGLSLTVDNELTGNSVICLCCGCCCSHLGFNYVHSNNGSPFRNRLTPEAGQNCIFCKKCDTLCYFDAIEVDPKRKTFRINSEKCIGCGICKFVCPEKNISLKKE